MKIKFAPFAALKLVSHCVFRFSFVFSKSLSKAPKSVGFGWGEGGVGKGEGGRSTPRNSVSHQERMFTQFGRKAGKKLLLTISGQLAKKKYLSDQKDENQEPPKTRLDLF